MKLRLSKASQQLLRGDLDAIVRITNRLSEMQLELEQEVRWLLTHQSTLRRLILDDPQINCDGECLGDHRRWKTCKHGINDWPGKK